MFIQPPTLDFLPHPCFIATEGMGDARFVDELLQFRKITNCGVGCPSRQTGGSGKEAFLKYFAAIQTARTRAKSVPLRGLLVIADADDNAGDAFKAVVDAMTGATFPVPQHPFSIEVSIEVVPFRVGIYLLPGSGRTGCLEHILLEATVTRTPHLAKCLDDFSTCSGALKSVRPNKHAKMRMSALAAAFCEDNPWASAHTMWSDNGNPVPISSECFKDLREFLSAFSG
jgi:hypothetical protein